MQRKYIQPDNLKLYGLYCWAIIVQNSVKLWKLRQNFGISGIYSAKLRQRLSSNSKHNH
jgi:hypothetical protein